MNLNQIIVDNCPRNYHGGFVLIKPSKPFYVESEDYQILSFPQNQVVCKARLIKKETYDINEIPDLYSILFRDLPTTRLKNILKSVSTERTWDVLLFSSNSHYNDWYKDRKQEAKEMRAKEVEQLELL